MKLINATSLIGLKLISPNSKVNIGQVSDLIVQPLTGQLLGLIGTAHCGAKLKILTKDFVVNNDQVELTNENFKHSIWYERDHSQGVAAFGRLIGKKVYTDGGRRLGKIEELIISDNFSDFQYKIADDSISARHRNKFYLAEAKSVCLRFNRSNLMIPESAEKFIFKIEIKSPLTAESFYRYLPKQTIKNQIYPVTVWMLIIFCVLGAMLYL